MIFLDSFDTHYVSDSRFTENKWIFFQRNSYIKGYIKDKNVRLKKKS